MDARDGRAGAEPAGAGQALGPPRHQGAPAGARLRADAEDLGRVFLRFKELADKKKEVSDLDLEALVADEVRRSARSTAWTGCR